jgi:hypothetical protein
MLERVCNCEASEERKGKVEKQLSALNSAVAALVALTTEPNQHARNERCQRQDVGESQSHSVRGGKRLKRRKPCSRQQTIRQIKRIRMTECATVQPNQLFSYYPCGMPDSTNERWMELCSQAAQEQDAKKLLALTQEINRPLSIST